jgi:selenide,water dikinase
MVDILFDPQTSGGLLISVPAADAEPLVKRMRREGIKDAAIIGEVVAKPKGRIVVR